MACILTCYYRPKPGGLCKRLFRAINALLERGHTVHYLSVVQFPIEHPNCHFHRFPWPQGKTEGLLFWGVFHAWTPCVLLVLGIRHSVSLLFAFGPNYGLMLQPLRLWKRAPLSLFLRADGITNHRIMKRPFWLITLESFFESLAIAEANLYCVSSALENVILSRHKWCRPKLYRVLPNEVPPILGPVKGSPRNPIHLASVGILEARKNHPLLLDAIASIPLSRIQLRIFGVGPDEARLRALAERSRITDRVFFMGWVDPNDLWDGVDLLLFPSVHEGSPNAVLEAIAHGIPVLASDIPEHREILPAHSLLPSRDARPWTSRLLNILENPEELPRLATAQRKHARHLRFDWDRTICELITGCI